MKKVWVYVVIIFIIILTILGMIFLSNNVSLSFKTGEVLNNIMNLEAQKIKPDYPWVYTYHNDNDNILIPYFNINNKLLKKINDDNINEDLNDVKQTSYLYSINDSLLSLIYTKEYNDNYEYQVYNFNLDSSRLMNYMDVLNYLDIDYDELINKIELSIEIYLKKYNYPEDVYEMYLAKNINHLNDSGLSLYVGSNKEIYAVIKIYHDKVENVLLSIN